MKRSEINAILKESIAFAKQHQVYLPAFADWLPSDWENLGEDYRELIDNMLGWDVTDFGSGDFENYGLVAFTFRNGNYGNPQKYPKPYCEKLLILAEGQELPFHFHKLKEEDTINRGGGNLQLTVYNSTADEDLDKKTPVTMVKDGHRITVPAGGVITLHPGESLTTTQRIYHKWDVEPGTGKVLVWEVSSTNDDNIDNRFLKTIPRIPTIEEDETPYRILFGDYPQLNTNF
ncbi:MAG: D-lyxose/D-mannose family sugar isomerase [Lactobacillus sp.]|jgi:D-lyxose ketol-isomerase|nr:D-lyxose/D-mannose family sugar isomerase [Lactobacillus sp.]